MEKSFKNSHLFSLLPADRFGSIKAAVFAAALLLGAPSLSFATTTSNTVTKPLGPKPGQLENHKDLIAKAQNLTLQRDRLQASQVLIRAIYKEKEKDPKGNAASRELARALDDLTALFYTEKAQSLNSTADAVADLKPREAIEAYQEALRLEGGNVTVLKSLARVLLKASECSRAEAVVKNASAMNPFSPEVHLLVLQVLSCQKDLEGLALKLENSTQEMASLENYVRSFQIELALKNKDTKKARNLALSWEGVAPDYPEVHYWKWEIARQNGLPDRLAAVKYTQLCQSLTPRKRKTHGLDVNLCKGKQLIDAYLKDSGLQKRAPEDSTEGSSK